MDSSKKNIPGTLADLIVRSLNKKPIGEGTSNNVYKIDEEGFDNYLIRTDMKTSPAYFYPNFKLKLQDNIFEGKNFGQSIYSLQGCITKLEFILYAGTCINKSYKSRIKKFDAQGVSEYDSVVNSYYNTLDEIIALPQGSYDKMVADMKGLHNVGRIIDSSRANIAMNGDKINFFDTIKDSFNFSRQLDFSNLHYALTGFDNDDCLSLKYEDNNYIQKSIAVQSKIDISLNKNIQPSFGFKPQTQIEQKLDIKLSLKTATFLKKLKETEERYGLQTIF